MHFEPSLTYCGARMVEKTPSEAIFAKNMLHHSAVTSPSAEERVDIELGGYNLSFG